MAVNSAAAAPAAPTGAVSFPWWVNLVAGILTIIIGLLLLAAPAATTAVITQILGLYWLIDGIIRLVSLFVNRSGWGWKLCMGVIGIIAGLAVLQHPLWSTFLVPATLAIVVGVLGIILGIIQVIAAFKGAGWATGLFGAGSVVLGLLILMNPLSSTVALPTALGFLAVAAGIMILMVSVGSRVRPSRRQAPATVSQ